MADNDEEIEECICEGAIDGVFNGFRNYDTIFKIQGAGAWRQDEYVFQYHYLFSPHAQIIKVTEKKTNKEIFYIEVDGVKTRVRVKYAYI